MTEERFALSWNKLCIDELNTDGKIINSYCPNTQLDEIICLLNDQDNDNKFLFKIINFFAKNPMTKYSSIEELFEEMGMLDEMGLL